MFGIGIPELLLILVIGLIRFSDPGKLPEIGTAWGKVCVSSVRRSTEKRMKTLRNPKLRKPESLIHVNEILYAL